MRIGYHGGMQPEAQPVTNAQDLPALGDWDGPIFGQLGVLHTDGSKVECHCCGRWYLHLGSHVVRTHKLTVPEYQAIFGLNRTTRLAGPAYQATARQFAVRNFSS